MNEVNSDGNFVYIIVIYAKIVIYRMDCQRKHGNQVCKTGSYSSITFKLFEN